MHINDIDTTASEGEMLEIVEDYLIGGIIGFVAGAVATRLFFKSSIERRKIGEVIEWGMVEKTISQLNSMTTILNRLVADIKSSAEELAEKIEIAQDMEPVVKESPKNRK
jgi:hypothetical protein